MIHKYLSLVLVGFACSALVLLAPPPLAHAADQVVSDCGDSGKDNQFRAKLSAALSSGGGAITFTCGPATIVLTQGLLPDINANLTIEGGGKITLSGNDAMRLFVVQSGATLTLNNIIITKGKANADGGAVSNSGTLNVNNSKFLQNETDANHSGGAIVSYGALIITNSEFGFNKGGGGGAVYPRWNSSTTLIQSSRFYDNQAINTFGAGNGGALLAWDGARVTINNSTFTNNKTPNWGGAIFNTANSSLFVDANTIISGNESFHGGGIYNQGNATLNYITLSENSAYTGGGMFSTTLVTLNHANLVNNDALETGGGIYSDTKLTLNNVTLSGNSARLGGGIYSKGQFGGVNVTWSKNTATESGGALYNLAGGGLTNATLYGNSAPVVGGIANLAAGFQTRNTVIAKGAQGTNCNNAVGGEFNLSDDSSCGFGPGRINVPNLLLGPLANNGGYVKTHRPSVNPLSAAINTGTSQNVPGSDGRGVQRPQGVGVDVGAVEVCVTKPVKPTLANPPNKSTAKRSVLLSWKPPSCAFKYNVVVKQGSKQGTAVFSAKNLNDSNIKTSRLPKGSTYFWQVTAIGDAGKTNSKWWSFNVK